jgi:hypothetical protein
MFNFFKKEKCRCKEIVNCDECKNLIYLDDAQVIPYIAGGKHHHSGKLYYCVAHKKNYDNVYYCRYAHKFYKMVEVDCNGGIINL